ncbi:lytic transglycosylase domain-containing protein [Paenibacillus abyssi]|uniref:Transglycosylase SLT domain-containing protein n=1 Tax=Paenibacillus abyssi TaxID=1340531 RepID=A0A917FUM9_9BACL|nr:lytic transglycosylase domain-containing protein [Paenibacillus abyssi]GGG10485.1 hypothetical protein GCM10010916_29200 [Paenibacillus abyssi]
MSIDPRIMKTMLQLQWQKSLDFSSNPMNAGNLAASTTDGTSGSLFDSLLQQLLYDSNSAPADQESFMLPVASATPAAAASGLLPNPLPVFQIPPTYSTAASSTDNSDHGTEYETLINAASNKYGVDPSLIKAVIHTESSFRSDAVSSAGAKGLMQLMDATAKGLGVNDSFDPGQNIDGGTRYLSYLLRKYDNNELAALAAYNAGPGRVDRLGIRTDADVMNQLGSLPSETQKYIGKVTNARELFSI